MYRLLIVDDEDMERDCLKYLIHKNFNNIQIFEAGNGKEALEIARKNEIDILITDIKMPFLDGLSLLKEVSVLYPKIKKVVYSAFGEFDYAKQAIKLGVSEYIVKPIEGNDFINAFGSVYNEVLKSKELIMSKEEEFFNFIINEDAKDTSKSVSPEKMIEIICASVKSQDIDAVSKNIEKLFDILSKTQRVSSLYVRHLCVEIIQKTLDIFQYNHEKTLEIIESIGSMSNVLRLKDYIKIFLTDFILEFSNNNNSTDKKAIMKVVAIIKAEYENCISLEEVAEKIFLTPSYLSALFKKEMGINFVKFLNDYRLEQAKKLLDTTDMRIYDICRNVGFSSDSYFISQFKKVYGVTPANYKEGK